jgi:hypothetical protein
MTLSLLKIYKKKEEKWKGRNTRLNLSTGLKTN